MRRCLTHALLAVAMLSPVPALAQNADANPNCPPGAWFCAEAEAEVLPEAGAEPGAAPEAAPLPEAQEVPTTRSRPARPGAARPPVVVYQPPNGGPAPQVVIVTPSGQPPPRVVVRTIAAVPPVPPAPPPPPRYRWRSAQAEDRSGGRRW